MPGVGHRLPFLAVVLAGMVIAAGCGGGGDDGTSPASLSPLLIPPGQLRLEKQRNFAWNDPIDFVFDGILVPESIPGKASETVSSIEDAGFAAAAGEIAAPKSGQPQIHIEVAKFDSTDGAARARHYLHKIDLEQPCYGACDINPKEAPTFGIPDASSVHAVPIPNVKPPPGAGPPFERHVIEFTIGPFLYLADVGARPGDVSAHRWSQGVKAFYGYAKKKTPSSS